MSYPIHTLSNSSNARTVRTQTGFWGLDIASGGFSRDAACSKESRNLIWHGEALKVRPGYTKICQVNQRVNGIYFFQDIMYVHSGTELYRISPDTGLPELVYREMADHRSRGVVRNQTVTKRYCSTPLMDAWSRETVTQEFLFIHDGEHYLVFDGKSVRPVTDPYWGENIRLIADSGTTVVYYADVPFTAVAKSPDGGSADVDPRGDNQLTQFRCESFYVDDRAEVTDFVLTCPFEAYNNDVPPELQIRCDDGLWHNFNVSALNEVYRSGEFARLVIPGIAAGKELSISTDDRIVNLGYGVNSVANDGMDNVRLTYAVYKDPPAALTGATVQGFYGPDGGEEVLFLGGSAAAPGTDAFSEPDNFFCFYETSTERLGNSNTPITGYCHLNDGRMAVLKNDPDDSNVFFRSHKTVSIGTTLAGEAYLADAYPSVTGAAVEGCISPDSVGMIGNEPCFLAKSGLFSVRSVSNELTNLNETVRRSVSVDPLLQTLPTEKVRSICWNGYYLMAFDNVVLITDGRMASGSYRFLKWVFLHCVTAFAQHNGFLYFGSDDGHLFVFDGSATDMGYPIKADWYLPLLEEQTGRKMLLRRLWAAVSGTQGTLGVLITADRGETKRLEVDLTDKITADDAAWVSLLQNPRLAETFSVGLDLTASDAMLWGYRMTYEKGGSIG